MKVLLVCALLFGCAGSNVSQQMGDMMGTVQEPELTRQYNCDPETVKAQRGNSRMLVTQGMPLCTAIGRYGYPVAHTSGAEVSSLAWRVGGRYVSVMAQYRADTPENRAAYGVLGVGSWLINSVSIY